jgi:HSP20 family molecular chaperone IbpA
MLTELSAYTQLRAGASRKVRRSTTHNDRVALQQVVTRLSRGTRRSSCAAAVEGSAPSYPPYNIARTGENDYRISVAVAGFTAADLSIEVKENTLTLRGEKQTNDEEMSGRRALPGHRRAELRT